MINVVPILQVGAIGAPGVGDGRLIPFLTFSAGVNAELERAVDMHGGLEQPGDVIATWGWRRFDRSRAFLKLEFIRPVPVTVHFCFPVRSQGHVVEWIRSVNGLYLQSSEYGETVSQGWGKSSMLAEVSSEATFPMWESVYRASLLKKFKANGLSKKEAISAVQEHRNRQRELWFRRQSTKKVVE